jgi:TetR/AcrR family transcriptional regulator, regulator of autoinduction and epiphytic fitness
MNTNPSTPRLTERKRAAIVRAAIDEFIASGFDATSMDRIAARAEVSKRTVYNHFPGKEALFAETLHALWELSREDGVPVYRADEPLRGQLLDLLMRKLRVLNDESAMALARVAIAAGIHSPERARETVARMSMREEDLTVWIRDATADGRLKAADTAFASQQLQGMVKVFAFWPQVTMGQPPLTRREQKKVAAAAADMFLAWYACAE